tara:strand:- start:3444 stop:3752 length:309 start_codon:yes stop_codon:yes gene_type:complete
VSDLFPPKKDLYNIGDLVRLNESLFYSYEAEVPIVKAAKGSAYYAIGMKRHMIGIITYIYKYEHLVDPELWIPYNFIYKVWWSDGIGFRREQHCDLVCISKV